MNFIKINKILYLKIERIKQQKKKENEKKKLFC